MRNTITFFDTNHDLHKLTGLPRDDYDKALWDAGFDLDDWDWGFVSDTPWSEDWDLDNPYYRHWLMSKMADYCVGYDHTEYNGRHYYILHHS